jgi:hypothetical protein
MIYNHQIQETTYIFELDDYLSIWVYAFMMDRKAQNMALGTIHIGLGKGRKSRYAFLGAEARKAIWRY